MCVCACGAGRTASVPHSAHLPSPTHPPHPPHPYALVPPCAAGVFKAVVVANSVQKLNKDAAGPTFTEQDYDNIMVRGSGGHT